MRNPHFDDNRVVWLDEYSGVYKPPVYDDQFELQWKLALQGNADYFDTPGASTDDAYVADRVYEWTGEHPNGGNTFSHPGMGSYVLDHPIDPNLIKGKRCIDVGCGMGRWTRTMQRIGAREVLSVDVSASALDSTRQFNPHVERADILRLREEHSEWIGQFDFANLWGVAMHTHDPRLAFASAAAMVRPGGAIYLMVYAPEGIHNRRLTLAQRRYFHTLTNAIDRLAWVEKVQARSWDTALPFIDNVLNLTRNLRGLPRSTKMGILDMLEPVYNWVIPLDTVHSWMSDYGFSNVTVLNSKQTNKAAHHVLGIKAI